MRSQEVTLKGATLGFTRIPVPKQHIAFHSGYASKDLIKGHDSPVWGVPYLQWPHVADHITVRCTYPVLIGAGANHRLIATLKSLTKLGKPRKLGFDLVRRVR